MENDYFDIKISISSIINHFNEIKKKGWFIRKTNNDGEAGNKLEELLGKPIDNFQVPDFDGIEIKTKKINSYNNYITLFNAVPYGKDFFEIERIKKEYGYPDSDLKNCKVLNGDIFCKNKNKIGTKFFFQSQIDNLNKRINLLVFDYHGNLIDNETFWPFDKIREKLYCKLKYLAIIKIKTKKINNKQYYKYDSIEIFKLRSFEFFLKSIQYDYIKIQFKIGVFKSGKRIGQTHDRGTGFQINQTHIEYLYQKIYPN